MSAALALFWALGLAACIEPPAREAATAPNEEEQRPLALLNGERIYREDFDSFLNFTQGELQEDPGAVSQQELFREFLIRRILLQAARAKDIAVSSEEVHTLLSDWGSGAPPEDQEELFLQAKEFLTVQKFLRRSIEPKLNVTLEEALGYYEKNADEFIVPDRVHVLEILVDEASFAAELRGRISEGDTRTFRELAALHSRGVTAAEGGDLGIYQKGELPEHFEQVIFALRPGEVSRPFQSPHGYHLFMVEERVSKHAQHFYAVQSEIYERLITEKERSATEAVMNQLVEQASVTIYDSSLRVEIRAATNPEGILDE